MNKFSYSHSSLGNSLGDGTLEPVKEDDSMEHHDEDREGASDHEDDGSDISSGEVMGRQITQVTEAQCSDLIEQQCRGFQTRDSEFWRRQNSTPSVRRDNDCLEGLRRQISMPTHLTPLAAPARAEPNLKASVKNGSCPDSSPGQLPGSPQVIPDEDLRADEGLIENAICSVVSECNFSVLVADPASMDAELIAVSEGFLRLTGFEREEVLGENCRFLNQGCCMPEPQREHLCRSVETGSPFVGLLDNRKKSGNTFLNLLDLRGLVLAKNIASGEDIWVLIAIQQDVTDMDKSRLPKNHLPLLNQVVGRIRRRLLKQLAELGLTGSMIEVKQEAAPIKERSGKRSITRPKGAWSMVSNIQWKGVEHPTPSIATAVTGQRPQADTAPSAMSTSSVAMPPPDTEPGGQEKENVGANTTGALSAVIEAPASPHAEYRGPDGEQTGVGSAGGVPPAAPKPAPTPSATHKNEADDKEPPAGSESPRPPVPAQPDDRSVAVDGLVGQGLFLSGLIVGVVAVFGALLAIRAVRDIKRS